jgi:lysophospholipase L1-like esterase
MLIAILAALFFAAGVLSRPYLKRVKTYLASQVSQKEPDHTPYNPAHHARRRSQFSSLGQTRKIVLLGDGHVEAAEWAELFSRSDISNRGIMGDTTKGILERLPSSLPNDYALCVVHAGINDLTKGCSVSSVVANYKEILNYLTTQRRGKVVVASVILAGEDRAPLNADISELNLELSQLVPSVGAVWLDINALLCPDGFLPIQYTNDGLHLNGEGYRVVCNAMLPELTH